MCRVMYLCLHSRMPMCVDLVVLCCDTPWITPRTTPAQTSSHTSASQTLQVTDFPILLPCILCQCNAGSVFSFDVDGMRVESSKWESSLVLAVLEPPAGTSWDMFLGRHRHRFLSENPMCVIYLFNQFNSFITDLTQLPSRNAKLPGLCSIAHQRNAKCSI